MADKQIIIDGVDVSGCENYKDYTLCCSRTPNCNYKKYKRKEQEYEELRQYHNKYCEEFEKEKKEWLEKYNQVSSDFYNGKYCNKENCNLLKAKEQECEELKIYIESNEQQVKEVETLVMDNDRLINELDQLKAENEELKEILNEGCLHNLTLMTEQRVLLQTLTEIKEIAENAYCLTNGTNKDMANFAKQILQKISECEGNDG